LLGFVSVYNNISPEFTAIAIASVPEPATLSLCGAGGFLALMFCLRRKV
jgi:hypothetical protein